MQFRKFVLLPFLAILLSFVMNLGHSQDVPDDLENLIQMLEAKQ